MNLNSEVTVIRKPITSSFLLGILVCIFISSCSFLSPCSNEIKDEVISPDNLYKAVVFSRDCGATSDFSTQISIIPRNEQLPNDAGNIFIEDSDHGAAKTLSVIVKWTGPRAVLVKHDAKARLFLSKENIELPSNTSKQEKFVISYGVFSENNNK